MEIIPVIDLMGGNVVQAGGGDRMNYPPLKSVLTKDTDPEQVIADLISIYPFKTFYLADLDAIFYQTINLALYRQLANFFPEVSFWIDAGIRSQQDWMALKEITGMEPVLASETLDDLKLLQSLKQSVLSLDFQYGAFLGRPAILQQFNDWPDNIIVMNLDSVGSQAGSDIKLLQQIQQKRPDVNVIAAGGIRNQQDLIMLKKIGVKSVLVASALHTGSLKIATVNQ